MDAELERFKVEIDLRQFAAAQGYTLDARESWPGSAVMRAGPRGTGDKIIIKREPDGHYVYCSCRNGADSGSIIDFVQRRRAITLGHLRKDLRGWLTGTPPTPLPPLPDLVKTGRDRHAVEQAFLAMAEEASYPYLSAVRQLPDQITQMPRFRGRVRRDQKGNVIFPHFDADGLCGFEIKNRGFTGFATGGTKGLWLSHESPSDHRLVVCEGAIDCLSHAALFPDPAARYVSIGGRLNPSQPALITAAVKRLPAGGSIVAGLDADVAGRTLTDSVREAFLAAKRLDLGFFIQLPTIGNDWNDQLRALPKGSTLLPAALFRELGGF
jgi:Toprim-like/Protein of unknown function (DUF3991)